MPPEKTDPQFYERLAALVTCDGPRERVEVRAPFTGGILGHLPACEVADVERAVARARPAQIEWAALPWRQRSRIFLRFHDLLFERQNKILDIIQMESGKGRRHAFEEVLDTAVVARYYARHAESILRPRRRNGALPLLTKTWEFRCPVGVVGFLIPWNYPLSLSLTDAVAALMAGNAGVLKPDPQTSFTALWAVALLREAGVPEEVLAVVTGAGPVIGPAITDRVDYVMFTGSSATGRIVGQQAAGRLIGSSLELAGKNPMIVLADADVNSAVDGAARGCFVGAGQVCVSIERIYVHESLYSEFLARFAERARRMKLGAELSFEPEMGSMASERQVLRVEDHVADAVDKGASVVTGGRRRPDAGPFFYEPTILTGVGPDMKVYADETFGPVVSVYPFATEDEAIKRANETRYGLSACIWSRNTRRAARLALRIDAGSVNINEPYAATWGSVDSPIGGFKESGLRPRHGAEGILKYTAAKTVAVQRLLPIAPPGGMDAETYACWMTRLLKIVRRVPWMG